jgi:bacteriophage protein of unknown function (DUF646)|nr:MAG TPA: hypothetical protein [Caudoviricetes sp.]
MASLEFLNIDDLIDNIANAIADYPEEAEKALNRTGLALKKELANKTPDSGTDHKKKLSKSWKKRVTGTNLTNLQAEVFNTAPHIGLVDRGHRLVSKTGKTIGFVQGKHFIDSTTKEVGRTVLPVEMDKMVKKLKKKIEG